MNFVEYAAIILLVIIASFVYHLTLSYYSVDKPSVYINCVNGNGSVAWRGDAKYVQYNKGKWSFYDAMSGDEIRTSADCTVTKAKETIQEKGVESEQLK